jgi:hypothetical protein
MGRHRMIELGEAPPRYLPLDYLAKKEKKVKKLGRELEKRADVECFDCW